MSTFHLRSFTGIQEHLNVNLWSIQSKGDQVSWTNTDAWKRSYLEWPKRLDPMKDYGMNSTTLKICICPLQAVAFIVWSLRQKWSTVPYTRALKYYIPLGDISIVAWPSSLKREAYGMGKEPGHHLGRGHGLGMKEELRSCCYQMV